MNRRFIAPFLAVDMTRSLGGGGYSPGLPALAGNANGAGGGFATGMGPATDAPIGGGGGAVTSPGPANPGRQADRSA